MERNTLVVDRTGDVIATTRLVHRQRVCEHLVLTAGRCPAASREVALSAQGAGVLGVGVGSELFLAAVTGPDGQRLPLRVVALWTARDVGEALECRAGEYLEFDHVIPHSKGGATSIGNLQLLCRGCNQRKGARL